MKMQKLLLTITGFLFCSLSVIAQCNLHTKKDDFTGKVSNWTNQVLITKGGTPALLKKYGNDCRYKIYLRFVSNNNGIFISASEDADYCLCTISGIEFKFSDGSVVGKSNAQIGEHVKTTLGMEQFTFFAITADELTKLSKEPIAKFRIREPNCTEHPVIEEEMDEKVAEKLQKDAACILERVKSGK